MGRGRAITVAGTSDKSALTNRIRELVAFSRSQGYRGDELLAMIRQLS